METLDSGITSVVAVEAHPDDVELGCLGTLLKLRERGTRVTIVSVTNGDKGATDRSVDYHVVAMTRAHEASAVAAALGGEFVGLGAEDEYLYDTPKLRNALAAVFRRAGADLVLAPPPTDYQTDHTITAEIAFQATHLSALAQLPIDAPALPRAPRLYYYDTILGLDFQPSFYLDISSVIDEKKRLAALHRSQLASMKAWFDLNLIDQIEIVGRYRGLQSGVGYAEVYQPCQRFPRLRALRSFPC